MPLRGSVRDGPRSGKVKPGRPCREQRPLLPRRPPAGHRTRTKKSPLPARPLNSSRPFQRPGVQTCAGGLYGMDRRRPAGAHKLAPGSMLPPTRKCWCRPGQGCNPGNGGGQPLRSCGAAKAASEPNTREGPDPPRSPVSHRLGRPRREGYPRASTLHCHPRACLPLAKAEGPEDPAVRVRGRELLCTHLMLSLLHHGSSA